MTFSLSPGVYISEIDTTIVSSSIKPLPCGNLYPYQVYSFDLDEHTIDAIKNWAHKNYGDPDLGRWSYHFDTENRVIYTNPRHFFLISMNSESDWTLFKLTWSDEFAFGE